MTKYLTAIKASRYWCQRVLLLELHRRMQPIMAHVDSMHITRTFSVRGGQLLFVNFKHAVSSWDRLVRMCVCHNRALRSRRLTEIAMTFNTALDMTKSSCGRISDLFKLFLLLTWGIFLLRQCMATAIKATPAQKRRRTTEDNETTHRHKIYIANSDRIADVESLIVKIC